MISGLWARVSALFEEVPQRPAPEREAWLQAHSDETTRAAVTELLRAYDSDPGLIRPRPPATPSATSWPRH